MSLVERIGSLGVPIYVGSTALVLIALLRNVALPGLWVVAVGALSNMAAIAITAQNIDRLDSARVDVMMPSKLRGTSAH